MSPAPAHGTATGNTHQRLQHPEVPGLGIGSRCARSQSTDRGVIAGLIGKRRENYQSSSYLRQSCMLRNCVIQLPGLAKS